MPSKMRHSVALMETGAFSGRERFATPPGAQFTQQFRLLERYGTTFTVTPAGQNFYKRAKRRRAAFDATLEEVRRIDREWAPGRADAP